MLQEAVDTSNPLLEKLKFLAITSSNLDEFFMIRVAGLKHQKENGVKRRDIANMTPTEQLENISRCLSEVGRPAIYAFERHFKRVGDRRACVYKAGGCG